MRELGKDEEKTEERASLLETIDDLVFHMNDARMLFVILSISSLIIAPIAIVIAIVFIAHPLFLPFLLHKNPFFGVIFFIYIIFVVVLSLVWLYVGLKEYRFLSKWNERFKKYISLKERIDRELQRE